MTECRVARTRRRLVACAAALVASGGAQAVNFETEGGLKLSWNTSITLGQSRRMQDADPKLLGRGFDNAGNPKGGLGSDGTDDGEVNFRNKGDVYSTQLKAVSDVEAKYQNYGLLLRGKGWYDYGLKHADAVQGGQNDIQGMGGGRLSDAGFDRGNRFQGVKLLDAMVYGNWDLPGSNLSLRLGRQGLNWGESLFIQGVNQINPIDVTALRKPGVEVKEAFLPVNMLYGNLGIKGGPSIEAFYQLKWEKTQLDPCGTMFNGFDGGIGDKSCIGVPINAFFSTLSATTVPASYASWYNDAFFMRNGIYIDRFADRSPRNSGQWGLSMKYLFDPLDTEFGLYYMNVHAKTPAVSAFAPNMTLTTPNAALVAAGAPAPLAVLATRLQSMHYRWDYAEDVKVIGLSAATTLLGWSVGSELSYTKGLPVQLNGSDIFSALLQGAGPLGPRAKALKPGDYFQGYDRRNKTQLQFNAVKSFGNVLGADSLAVAGEVGLSYANGLPDYTEARYLRGFQFGFATDGGGPGGAILPCRAATSPTLGTMEGCAQAGFATKTAWGYRIRTQLNYTVMPGFSLMPGLSWSHDVRGNSLDSQFVNGRKVIGLSLKADYQKRYFGEIAYTRYADSAVYDTMRDKDSLSIFVGTSF